MKIFKKKNKKDKDLKSGDKEQKKGSMLKDVIDGSLLTRESVVKQLPYILFVTVLCIFYIANRYHAEKVIRQTVELRKEVKELRTEKIAVQSELMNSSKRTVVLDSLKSKDLNLIESRTPPVKIIVNALYY
ncbi:MAG: hypothetical protein A2W91_06135 [Bacteroidetes bacterium GWF2_38_335]|nr:MAG: hypothetical protein A2W91_06135 [Bacteroidetes bacterium GWF2_38_335]OFY79671.1 MAG: hypothetical protein A2281_09545 [Bacteroidetes bacterium RIFOXYA12_FULL_38_20]HBS89006.1 hypothetical protein [Bacteroidales bacterium]